MTLSILVIYSLLAVVLIYSALYFLESLGSWPPDAGVHHQNSSSYSKENTDHIVFNRDITENSKNEGSLNNDHAESKQNRLNNLVRWRGLAAQEGVWQTSHVLAIIAAIQTVIGIAGLFAIIYTLIATKATLREARRTTRQATLATKIAERTALATEKGAAAHVQLQFSTNEVPGRPNEVAVTMHAINYGKSVALDCKIGFNSFSCRSDQLPEFIEVPVEEHPPTDISADTPQIWPPKYVDKVSLIPEKGHVRHYVVGFCYYRTVFDKKRIMAFHFGELRARGERLDFYNRYVEEYNPMTPITTADFDGFGISRIDMPYRIKQKDDENRMAQFAEKWYRENELKSK